MVDAYRYDATGSSFFAPSTDHSIDIARRPLSVPLVFVMCDKIELKTESVERRNKKENGPMPALRRHKSQTEFQLNFFTHMRARSEAIALLCVPNSGSAHITNAISI